MKILEKYTGTKTYMFPNGGIASPGAVLQSFPAALAFTHVVETDENGEVLWALENLSALRSLHDIPRNVSEAEAIRLIQEKINAPQPAQGADAMERIAAAMEFQNLMSLGDV